MVREIDIREGADLLDDPRRETLQRAAARVSDHVLPGQHRVRVASFDPGTGNAAVVVSEDAAPGGTDYAGRALKHVQTISPVLGLTEDQPPEFAADPQVQTTSTGAVAVHLRQQYKGIGIYDAAETVRFHADGSIEEVAGRSVSVPADAPVVAAVSPEQALRTAAAHVAEASDPADAPTDQFGEPMVDPGLDLTDFAPVLRTSGADRPDRPTTFDAPPFQHVVTVSLVWLPVAGTLRLCWQTKLAVPDGAVYRVLVDAGDGSVALAVRLTRSVAGRADVVLVPGTAPATVTMPLQLASYGLPVPDDLPAGFPDPWLTDASTRGSSVEAVVEPGAATVSGTLEGGTVVFPSSAPATDQLVVNLFALCSAMHDRLYLLGFREDDGNFQVDNHARGGRPADSVLARVHPGPVYGTANMGTPADGSRPTMNMGLVSSTNRHTALDADVVFHEYTHGLTNRLVGGPLNDAALEALQSGGMGEGWSDFFACTALGKTVVGDWVVNRPAGIRKFPYTEDFPDTYADLGTGRYASGEPHNLGELWCATLMSLARRLGAPLTCQVVVDALKLTVANPSFLAARDAILLAARHHGEADPGGSPDATEALVHTVWQVFAHYGMGPGARTDGAAVLSGIVADFDPPPAPVGTGPSVRAEASPALPIPDASPSGVRSEVTLPDAGTVGGLTVTADLTHPYVGDLVVALVAPGGARVVLRSRTGSSGHDVHDTWRDTDHPGLAGLVGTTAGGTWALEVADLARRDIGTFDHWSVEATVTPARASLSAETSPGVAIPDDDPAGVRSTLVLDGTGALSGLTVEVDITHTYVGDLVVTLTGPDATTVTLANREGGSADNLIESYTSTAGGALAPFVGTGAAGTWELAVVDEAGRDVGKLNRWRLVATL